MDDQFQIGINTTADTSGAQAQAQAIKQLADETQRYQDTLAKMALADREQEAAAKKTAEAIQLKKDLVRQEQEAVEQKKLATEADREIAAGVVEVGEAEVKAAEQAASAGTKSVGWKTQAKAALKGLASEFPGLAHAAHLALNPITAAVAGLAAAISIWETRVANATRVLGGIELPDISDSRLKTYERAATAFETFAKGLQKTVEAYNSIEQASGRTMAALEREGEIAKRLLNASERAELASLKMRQGRMSPSQYEAEKTSIESRFDASRQQVEQETINKVLGEKGREVGNLQAEAQRKLAQAAKIKEITPGKEEESEARAETLAKAAERDIQERQKRIDRLVEMQSSKMAALKYMPWAVWNYDYWTSPSKAQEMEESGIRSDEEVIKSYRNFMRGKRGRADRQSDRSRLIEEATGSAGKAYTIGQDLETEWNEFQRGKRVSEIEQAATNLGRGADLQGTAARAIQSGQEVQRAAINAFKALEEQNRRFAEEFRRELKALSRRPGRPGA